MLASSASGSLGALMVDDSQRRENQSIDALDDSNKRSTRWDKKTTSGCCARSSSQTAKRDATATADGPRRDNEVTGQKQYMLAIGFNIAT